MIRKGLAALVLLAALAFPVIAIAQSVQSFNPIATASLSVTTVSSRVALPSAGPTILVTNTGTTAAYLKFGGSTVVATTSDLLLSPGCSTAYNISGQTYVAAITGSDSATLEIVTGGGLPTLPLSPCTISATISGSIVANNASVGSNGATAPSSSTEIGSVDDTGKLRAASSTYPVPVTVSGGVTTNPSVGSNNATGPTSSTQIGAMDNAGVLQAASPTNPLPVTLSGGGAGNNVTIANPIGQATMAGSVSVAIASDQSALPVDGGVADGTTSSSTSGSKTFGQVITGAAPDYTAENGNLEPPSFGSAGEQVVAPFAGEGWRVRGKASGTDTSAHSVLAAAGTGLKNYVTDVECSNTSTVSSLVTFDDSAASVMLVKAGDVAQMHLQVPLVTAANTAFTFSPGTAVTTMYCNAQGYAAQ